MGSGSDRTAARRRLQDVASGLIAAAAHAALLLLAMRFGAPAPAPADAASQGLIEIDLPAAETPREAPPAPPSPPDVARPAPVRSVERNGHEALPALPPGPIEPPPPAPSAAPAPVAASEYGSAAPAVPLQGSGIQYGPPLWAVPGALPGGGPDVAGAETAKSAPVGPRVTAAPGATVLRDTVLAQDRERGIGNPGGTAITNAVEYAVRSGNVPNEASAVLVAHVGGDGLLISLGVQTYDSGDGRAWKSVAQAAAAALGGRALKLAGLGPKGAVVRVQVRSSVTYPSGSKERVAGRLPSLTEGPPRDVAPAPSPDGDACAPERWSDLKPLCGVGAKIGTFDVTDAVSRKHRNVRASFEVTLLDGAVALSAPAPAASALPAGTGAPSSPSAAPAAVH